jgi:nucleoside-diphosphate-sugar epimerase
VQAEKGDLSDEAALARLCAGADAVLHLAGALSGSALSMTVANVDGAANLARAAHRAGVKRFVHVSSLAAREPSLSPYAATKRAGEEAVKAHFTAGHLLTLRPPAIFGEGDLATLPLLKALCSPLAVLPGKASARFSILHVAQLAALLTEAVTSPSAGLLEVDDGHGAYEWADLVEATRRILARPQRVLFLPRPLAMSIGHVADLWSSLTGKPGMISAGKMRELYHPDWVARGAGWPTVRAMTLEEGLRRTYIWAMAEGLLPPLPIADRSPAP